METGYKQKFFLIESISCQFFLFILLKSFSWIYCCSITMKIFLVCEFFLLIPLLFYLWWDFNDLEFSVKYYEHYFSSRKFWWFDMDKDI